MVCDHDIWFLTGTTTTAATHHIARQRASLVEAADADVCRCLELARIQHMYAFGSQLACTRYVGTNHDGGYSNWQGCSEGRYHFQADVFAWNRVSEDVGHSCGQKEEALNAQGEHAEPEQVLQA